MPLSGRVALGAPWGIGQIPSLKRCSFCDRDVVERLRCGFIDRQCGVIGLRLGKAYTLTVKSKDGACGFARVGTFVELPVIPGRRLFKE